MEQQKHSDSKRNSKFRGETIHLSNKYVEGCSGSPAAKVLPSRQRANPTNTAYMRCNQLETRISTHAKLSMCEYESMGAVIHAGPKVLAVAFNLINFLGDQICIEERRAR